LASSKVFNNKATNRALHAHLQPKTIASYAPTLMRNARQHVLDIIDIPDKHQEHAKKFVEKFIFILTLDSNIDIPIVQVFGICSHGFSIW
jgi:hypothetical protein